MTCMFYYVINLALISTVIVILILRKKKNTYTIVAQTEKISNKKILSFYYFKVHLK